MTRRKKGPTVTKAEDWDPYRFKVVPISHKLTPEEAARRLEDTVNKARDAGRGSEQNTEIHPGATMVIIQPLDKPITKEEEESIKEMGLPPELTSLLPAGFVQVLLRGKAILAQRHADLDWHKFIAVVLGRVNPRGDLKKEVPEVVTTLLKENKVPLEKIREFAAIPKERWGNPQCDNPDCPGCRAFKDMALIVTETLQTFLKENLQ